MKTVMKKMFCLLLVAVLLVSAVPVAFAAEPTIHCDEHGRDAEYNAENSVTAKCDAPGKDAYLCKGVPGTGAEDNHYLYVTTTTEHTPNRATAKCEKSIACTVCGTEIKAALGHNYVASVTTNPTCTAAGEKTYTCSNDASHTYTEPIAATGHSPNANGICADCGICVNCNNNPCICCAACGNTDGTHKDSCSTQLCPKGCGKAAHGDSKCCTVCNQFGHHQTACPTLYETCCNVAKGSEHRTGCSYYCDESRNCPNANIPNAAHKDDCEYNLCSDTQCTFEKGHSGNHSYECQVTPGCTRANGHGGACNPPADPNAVCSKCNGAHETADCPNDGDYDLKIYATMWTGDGREETVYLGTFYNLATNTKIADYMKANSNRIHNWVAAKCSGYGWNDGKIYEDKKSSDEIEWNDRIGYSDQEAFINVSRPSKDVVLFLHTARVYNDYDWIKVEGKTTDDTLSLDEAKAIVKKYYSFSSLKMYSNENWNEYVDGNNNIAPQKEVEIGSENVTKIHILMSGYSAKTSSGTSSSYTADSSNPKTGDDIFAPAMIMGLSASALAVVYFLNKKRAF